MANGALTRDPLIRAFGAVLRGHREAAGLSRPALANALGCTPQWIEKLETAQRAPSEATSEDLDTYFKTPETFHRMWVEIRRAGKHAELPPGFSGFVELEAKATIMYIFENMVITGLFQTPAYAHEVLKVGRKEKVTEQLVTTRLERQQILAREDPPEIILVLDEWALHRPIGEQETRKEQIGRLIELAQQPNITIQIVPSQTGTYAGLPGAFTLLSFEEGPDLVYVGGHVEDRMIDQSDKVRGHELRFNLIRGAAMSADDSLKLLRTVWGSL
ncbi:helix-turn-helix transcriptional regulator [Actinoallomurus sp. NPDC050550]|uniref:helix-turn-helix domain-containing protein n=1 Tax=Actinoallomurus sp. NPDC050550 TaxID=3154937 RepID=UPI0033D4A82F